MGEWSWDGRGTAERARGFRQLVEGREAREGTRANETLGPLISNIGRETVMVAGRLSVDCEVVFEGSIPRRVVLYPHSRCEVFIHGDALRDGTVADTLGEMVIEGQAWDDPESSKGARSVGDGIEQRMGDASAAIVPRDWARRREENIRALQWDTTGMDGGHYGFDAGERGRKDSRGEDV